MVRAAMLLAFAAAIVPAQPAQACSFSWKRGYSPDEIEQRRDVMVVRGSFRFVDGATGKDVPEGENVPFEPETGELLGFIERASRRPIRTRQAYSEFSIQCAAYLAPTGMATGRFWVEKQRGKDGRHRLLMWKPD